MKTIFDHQNYKTYLEMAEEAEVLGKRGFRSAVARAAGCQTAYVSQVLNGGANLSLEQAELISTLLGHSREEGHYFLLLVQLERAGTSSLKSYFQSQVAEVLQKRMVLKHRLDVKATLSVEHQATYYSAWYFAAIHVALTIPELRQPESIARRLKLPLSLVKETLEFLLSVGLAVYENGKWQIGTTRIHLANDSPLISKHHTNWRMQSIAAFDRRNADDLHYSSVVTLSDDDVLKVKSRLVETIEQIKTIIKDSPGEGVHSFTLDFFRL